MYHYVPKALPIETQIQNLKSIYTFTTKVENEQKRLHQEHTRSELRNYLTQVLTLSMADY